MTNLSTHSAANNKVKLPLSFIKNQGQEDDRSHFSTNVQGRKVFCSSDRITLVELEQVNLPSDPVERHNLAEEIRNGVALELSFTGADTELVPQGITELPGRHHYLKGTDQNQWTGGVLHYKALRYTAVWEGVDLELYGSEAGLKMNWVLNDPSKVSSVALHWAGAESLKLEDAGNLLVHHALGSLTDPAPYAYQEIDGQKVTVDCTYRLDGDFDIGFEISGAYDTGLPLVIDPAVQFTTLLGGSTWNSGRNVAVDSSGCAYVVGETDSIDFPTTPGAFQTALAGMYNAYVTKFSADGSSLIYSTYLGGSDYDDGSGIAVDSGGFAYVAGYTSSPDFPVTPGAYQTTLMGYGAGFITKLAADGASLIYSTYLGEDSSCFCIAINAVGHAYVAGGTESSTFPVTPGAFQSALGGSNDAFVTKISADGASLIYSTYLGGSEYDVVYSIAVDSEQCAHVCGDTYSTNFPVTLGAFQTANTSASYTGFVTKLAADGESLIYSTYLGGTLGSVATGIAINPGDCACVTGQTYCQDFPVTPSAFQLTNGYADDANAFISILTTDGSALLASTYLGGSIPVPILIRQSIPTGDSGAGIAVNRAGLIYVTGRTSSLNFPTSPSIIPSSYGGGYSDAFISILSKDLSSLWVSYYLGGSESDFGSGIAVDSSGALYAAGSTDSPDFPTTEGAYQETLSGDFDAYLTKAQFFVFYNRASMTIQGLF